jgi:hypothetical protein
VLRVKQQLTGAKTSIERGADILDALATAVRAQLQHVELLLAAADEDAPDPPIAAVPAARPQIVREPDPPYPGAERLPF